MAARIYGWIGAELSVSPAAAPAAGPPLPELPLLVAAPFTAVFLAAGLVLLPAWTITLAAPGVSLLVQSHLPFASAQATPSLAVAYWSLSEMTLPNGSSRSAPPLVLLRESPVSAE